VYGALLRTLGMLSGNGRKKTEAEKQPCTLFSYCLRQKKLLTHSTIRKKTGGTWTVDRLRNMEHILYSNYQEANTG